jgi:hypothetical protein
VLPVLTGTGGAKAADSSRRKLCRLSETGTGRAPAGTTKRPITALLRKTKTLYRPVSPIINWHW